VQQPEPLSRKVSADVVDAGDVAAGPVEAGNETVLNRVIAGPEDDRIFPRRPSPAGPTDAQPAGWPKGNGSPAGSLRGCRGPRSDYGGRAEAKTADNARSAAAAQAADRGE
jgi:hypothetical protein